MRHAWNSTPNEWLGCNFYEGEVQVGDLVEAIQGDNVFVNDGALGIVLKVHDNAKSSSFQLITVLFDGKEVTWPRRTITRLIGKENKAKRIKELSTCS